MGHEKKILRRISIRDLNAIIRTTHTTLFVQMILSNLAYALQF